MNASAATVHFSPDFDAWLVTGVDDDGQGHQEKFRGEDGRARAIEHADKNFKFVSVIEPT